MTCSGERRRSRPGTRSRGGRRRIRCRCAAASTASARRYDVAAVDAAERHGDVDRVDVERVGVGVGVDAHGLDAEPVGGAGDADGDLAAVGDEEATDHQCLHTPYSVAPRDSLLWAADRAMPSTVRVSAGWMMPSSHTRPVA